MEQHVEIMLNEQVELCEKIVKLGDFISKNPIFDNLSKDEQYDMKLQHKSMTMYMDVLQHRIDREKAQKASVSAVHF